MVKESGEPLKNRGHFIYKKSSVNKRKYNWVIFGLLILLGLLIAALYRGCGNAKNSKEIDLSQRIKKLEADSINDARDKEVYQQTIEFQDGQLTLSNNKVASLAIGLDSANDRITALLRRHKPVIASTDTSITTVPNAFIADCSSCFIELENGQKLVLRYKAEKDNQESIFKGQINTKDSRIKSLEIVNRGVAQSYRSLIDTVDKLKAKMEFRRTLYFKLGALAINQPFPNSAGAGLIYQDKMKRMFGVGYYISPFGSIYSADIAFPLSLKRK